MDTNSLVLWRKRTATITEPKHQKGYALWKFPPCFISRTLCPFIISAYIFIDLSRMSWKSFPSFTSYELQYNAQASHPPPIYQLRTAIQCTRILRHNALVGSNWATCWDNQFLAGVKDFSFINIFLTSSAAYQTPIQWITDGTIARE
jgi:hypothetical protein